MSESKNKKAPLLIEPHPEDYEGYEFITLIKYYDKDFLCIVDNITKKHIISYVLDFCVPNNVNEEMILEVANHWYYNNREQYPVSVEFSKHRISHYSRDIVKIFALDYTTRIIGPVSKFEMKTPLKTQRRKVKFD